MSDRPRVLDSLTAIVGRRIVGFKAQPNDGEPDEFTTCALYLDDDTIVMLYPTIYEGVVVERLSADLKPIE